MLSARGRERSKLELMEKCHFCHNEDEVFYAVFKEEMELNACPHCYIDMFDDVDEDWLEAKEVA